MNRGCGAHTHQPEATDIDEIGVYPNFRSKNGVISAGKRILWYHLAVKFHIRNWNSQGDLVPAVRGQFETLYIRKNDEVSGVREYGCMYLSKRKWWMWLNTRSPEDTK